MFCEFVLSSAWNNSLKYWRPPMIHFLLFFHKVKKLSNLNIFFVGKRARSLYCRLAVVVLFHITEFFHRKHVNFEIYSCKIILLYPTSLSYVFSNNEPYFIYCRVKTNSAILMMNIICLDTSVQNCMGTLDTLYLCRVTTATFCNIMVTLISEIKLTNIYFFGK